MPDDAGGQYPTPGCRFFVRYAYPMMMELSGRSVVLIGAGAVAARKARGLIDAGATHLTCVAPDRRAELPSAVRYLQEAYAAGHLDGAFLVFAATDSPQVNDRVVADARARGIPVCRADGDERLAGDFVTPALYDAGNLRLGVSAGSAALSAFIRDRLRDTLDRRWIALADAMAQLRPRLRALPGISAARRREMFRALATEEALAAVAGGGAGGLLAWLAQRWPEVNDAH